MKMNKHSIERIEERLNTLRKSSDRMERKSDECYEAHDNEGVQKYDEKMEKIEREIRGIIFCLESIGYTAINPMDGHSKDYSRFIIVEL